MHTNFTLILFSYLEAFHDANESFTLEPTFKKSLLRCAIANYGLGNNGDAFCDLRVMLKLEPFNKTVLLPMKRCGHPTKMDSIGFRIAYSGHCLRRGLKKSASSGDGS